jgi:hypothetical protein
MDTLVCMSADAITTTTTTRTTRARDQEFDRMEETDEKIAHRPLDDHGDEEALQVSVNGRRSNKWIFCQPVAGRQSVKARGADGEQCVIVMLVLRAKR